MKHFPIFLAVEGRRIVLSGGGDAAIGEGRGERLGRRDAAALGHRERGVSGHH